MSHNKNMAHCNDFIQTAGLAKTQGKWDLFYMQDTSTKVWFFILSTSLALLVLGYQFGERLGLMIGFLLAVLLNFMVF
ncbi:MAG TPA: hypothetical protein VN132_04625, partial [Bdellovibrio sp.]|nr:hypothetical protein [Bdellovibrio sp.]